MPTIGKIRWARLVPALAVAFLLAAPPALADTTMTPPAPTLTSVTEADGKVTLEWEYGEDPYSFRWRGKQNDGGWASWGGGDEGNVVRAGGTARSYEIRSYPEEGIQPGNTYTFQIQAVVLVLPVNRSEVFEYRSHWSNSMSVTVEEE